MRAITYVDAIREAHAQLLASDDSVFVFGQGLWSPWYVGASMKDLDKEFGRERIIDSPVSENETTGAAIGAALCEWSRQHGRTAPGPPSSTRMSSACSVSLPHVWTPMTPDRGSRSSRALQRGPTGRRAPAAPAATTGGQAREDHQTRHGLP